MKILISLIFSLGIISPLFAAPIDIDTGTPLLIAVESISSNELQADGTVLIDSAADELELTFQAGFALTNTSRYVRVEFENATLRNALPVTGLAANVNYTSLLSQGGGIGDNFAVIEIFASTPQPPATSLVFESSSFRVLDTSEPLTATYTLYGTASDAVNSGPFIYRQQAEIVNFVSGLATDFADAYTMTVGFGTDFLRFNPTFRAPNTFSIGDSDGELASLAKFRGDFLILDNVRRASDSTLVSDFRDLLADMDTSVTTASIKGDFSSGDVSLNASDDCSGGSFPLTSDGVSKTIAISLDTLFAFPVLCVDLTGNTEAISRTEFELDLGLGNETAFFGKIRYDGSSVDLPFLTTFSDYRQKIYVTNQAGYEVRYMFEFYAEDSVQGSFEPGLGATGVIPASGVLKIDASELVTIEPGVPTRVSGRMLIDALPQDISAAVQLVSLSSSQPPVTNVLEVKAN